VRRSQLRLLLLSAVNGFTVDEAGFDDATDEQEAPPIAAGD
jgi:hypothetical protein